MSSKTRTERLLLRSSDPDLAGPIFQYYLKNRSFFSAAEPAFSDEYYTLQYQKDLQKQEAERMAKGISSYYYVSLKNEPNRIIGSMSFVRFRENPYYSTIFGYDIDEDEQNNGYATEACRAGIERILATHKVHRIEARVLPENPASIRVLEKLGFQYEGIEIGGILLNGVFRDHHRYAFINSNFKI